MFLQFACAGAALASSFLIVLSFDTNRATAARKEDAYLVEPPFTWTRASLLTVADSDGTLKATRTNPVPYSQSFGGPEAGGDPGLPVVRGPKVRPRTVEATFLVHEVVLVDDATAGVVAKRVDDPPQAVYAGCIMPITPEDVGTEVTVTCTIYLEAGDLVAGQLSIAQEGPDATDPVPGTSSAHVQLLRIVVR